MADIQIRKYLTFEKQFQPNSRKTSVHWVYNTKDNTLLGQVSWKSQWRRYCFFPAPGMVFDAVCLDTITVFIRNLMEARRHKRERGYKRVEP